MRKFLLMVAVSFIALSALASESGQTMLNAVCVTLKSGTCKYVAFTDQPKIVAEAGKLCVISLVSHEKLVVAECSDVEKITAEYHDFSSTNIRKTVFVNGKKVEEVYNIDGTKATRIEPGKIYIIQGDCKTRKVIK